MNMNKIKIKNAAEKPKRKPVLNKRGNSGKKREKDSDLGRIWSKREALESLKKVFFVSLEAARQEVTDEKSGSVEIKFNPTAANAATKAIDAANKMLGYSEPDTEEDESDLIIEVEIPEEMSELAK